MEAVLERKIKLVKEILDEKTTDRVLNSLEKFYHRLLSDSPCSFSQEELQERAERAEKEFALGGGIAHESMKRR